MVWGADGAMNGVTNGNAIVKAIDFAGGTVVHMTSGWSALILCIIVGAAPGYGKDKMPPHSMVLCMVGTAMLWVGWYGFNAGSALAADGIASNAFITTTLATAVGSSTWAFAEWIASGKSSVLGFCSGAIAGLVVVTPCCGFVNATGAVIIGLVAGDRSLLCRRQAQGHLRLRRRPRHFWRPRRRRHHRRLLAGILARVNVNPRLALHLGGLVGKTLWIEQIKAILIVMAVSIIGTLIAGSSSGSLIGLRPTREAEFMGLDLTEHGEEGYIL